MILAEATCEKVTTYGDGYLMSDPWQEGRGFVAKSPALGAILKREGGENVGFPALAGCTFFLCVCFF